MGKENQLPQIEQIDCQIKIMNIPHEDINSPVYRKLSYIAFQWTAHDFNLQILLWFESPLWVKNAQNLQVQEGEDQVDRFGNWSKWKVPRNMTGN